MFAFILAVLVAAPDSAARELTLADALATAHRMQPLVHLSAAQVRAAAARADLARAPLLPQLAGQAQYQRTTANYVLRPGSLPAGLQSQTAATLMRESNTSYNYFSFQASATQLVYDFNASIDRMRAARASAAAQDANAQSVALVVDYQVRNAYFAASAARAMVGVAQDTLDNQIKHMRQIEGYIAVGTRAEIDLAQARNDVASARVQLIGAENNDEVARLQLNQIMGVESDIDYAVADSALADVAGEEGDEAALLTEAAAQRPEYQGLGHTARAADLSVSAARGLYGPSLGVQAAISDQGADLRRLSWNWSAMGVLTWTFWGGGAAQAQVDEALATRATVQAQHNVLRQQVHLEVAQARLGVRAAKRSLEAAGDALFNARERLRYAEGRYETGIGSVIELGDAQVAVTTAAAQQVQATFQLSSARAALLKAVGRG